MNIEVNALAPAELNVRDLAESLGIKYDASTPGNTGWFVPGDALPYMSASEAVVGLFDALKDRLAFKKRMVLDQMTASNKFACESYAAQEELAETRKQLARARATIDGQLVAWEGCLGEFLVPQDRQRAGLEMSTARLAQRCRKAEAKAQG